MKNDFKYLKGSFGGKFNLFSVPLNCSSMKKGGIKSNKRDTEFHDFLF